MISYSSVIPSELGFFMWDPWAPSRAWMGTKKSVTLPKWKKESEVTQLCPTLCNPMDCSLPGSSVHGIPQARVLEWGAISFSRGSSQPRSPTLQADALTSELPGQPVTLPKLYANIHTLSVSVLYSDSQMALHFKNNKGTSDKQLFTMDRVYFFSWWGTGLEDCFTIY